MRRMSFVFAGSLFVLSACGGSQPPVEAAPPAPGGEAAEAEPTTPDPPPSKPFDELTQQEKFQVMKRVVVPTMKPLFQAQDATEFKDFGCVTCHGPHAKDGKFDMPNPELPKLNFADNLKAHKEKTPEMLTFMMEKVTPEMAKALNEPPYDPATQKGFGCGECHLPQE
jgi:hypothetical protein